MCVLFTLKNILNKTRIFPKSQSLKPILVYITQPYLCLKHLRNTPTLPTPCWKNTFPYPLVQFNHITRKSNAFFQPWYNPYWLTGLKTPTSYLTNHFFSPFSFKWSHILKAFFVRLSSGKCRALSQNLVHRTAVRIKMGNPPWSPSTTILSLQPNGLCVCGPSQARHYSDELHTE